MSIPWQTKVLEHLSGGLNSQSGEPYLADGEFSACDNFQTDNDGTLSARLGYVSVHANLVDAAAPIGKGLFERKIISGANQMVKISTDNPWTTTYLKVRNGTTGWTNVAPTAPLVPANCDFATAAQYRDSLYVFLWNSTTAISRFDGTNWVQIAGAPACQAGTVFLDRVWGIRDPAAPYTLYFSATGNGTNWTTSDSGNLDVGAGDGDLPIGIDILYNRLIIYKQFSVWVVDGDSYGTYSCQKVIGDAGCSSPRSVKAIENQVVALASKSIYSTDGSRNEDIAKKIRTTRQTGLNRARDSFSFALNFRKRAQYILFVSLSGSSVNNGALVYSYPGGFDANAYSPSGSWTTFSNTPFISGVVVQNAAGIELAYLLGNTNGKLYIYEQSEAGVAQITDDGVPITKNLMTRWENFGMDGGSFALKQLVAVMRVYSTQNTYEFQRNMGIQGAIHAVKLQFYQGADTGALRFYTNYDNATIVDSASITPPSPLVWTGIQKLIFKYQPRMPKMPRMA